MKKTNKELTSHAAAAKQIRNELKKNGVAARVKASAASMTSKVAIQLEDCPPWTVAAVEKFVSKFQYGHFDAMNDLYVYNSDEDLPQVKFVFVDVVYSDELQQQALDKITDHYNLDRMLLKDAPAILPIKSTVNPAVQAYTNQMIRNTLSGFPNNWFSYPEFWVKPVKRIMSVAA